MKFHIGFDTFNDALYQLVLVDKVLQVFYIRLVCNKSGFNQYNRHGRFLQNQNIRAILYSTVFGITGIDYRCNQGIRKFFG